MARFRVTLTILEHVTIEAQDKFDAEDQAVELKRKHKGNVVKTLIRGIKEPPKPLPDNRIKHAKMRKL